jgi:hypothetical protein
MSEKSILEQALLQVQNLEEAVKQNAKGILASTMKEELKDLLKESLEEEEDDEVMEQPETETDPEGEEEKDVTADDEETDDESDDDVDTDVDADTDLDNLDSTDDDDSDVDTGVDMENMGTDMDTDMESMGNESSMDDEDVMDMTGASDDEVLKVFKAMKPEDGIVVKKDGNNVEFGDGENEYIIKLDSEDSDLDTGMDMGADLDTDVDSDVDMDGIDTDVDADMDTEMDTDVDSDVEDEDEMEADEETIYEIELSEEDDEVEEPKKVEATEAARTKSNPHGNKNGMKRAGLPSKKMYKSGSGINEQVETLKKQNAEYKKALVLFKDKLNEVAVFNANLAYATRLFTEHSTTKQEKLNILKRFDTVSSMNEAKSLFSTIKTELGSKTTVTESVAKKISNTPSTSSSTEVLSESKAYENPQFSRIKEMMRKIK